MSKSKKSQEQKNLEREIEMVLKQKDKLVAKRLRMEIANRIIERQMNALSNTLNLLINKMMEAPVALTQAELRLAQVNRGRAIMAVHDRLNLPMDAARAMVDDALRASPHEEEN